MREIAGDGERGGRRQTVRKEWERQNKKQELDKRDIDSDTDRRRVQAISTVSV